MKEKKLPDEKVQQAQRLINLNEDSRLYFFEKADETWLKWLWDNGFFEVLKKKAEDPSSFSFTMPELRYLVRMAESNPETVTSIIIDVPLSKQTLNPEVVNQFLRICSDLPAEQLASLIGKITSENWPSLMQKYSNWGMDYAKVFEILEKGGYHSEILELARVVFVLRENWEEQAGDIYTDATPFCFTNLSYTKVFYYLSRIEEDYIFDAIDLSLSILTQFTKPVEENQKIHSAFPLNDIYPLYGVDFFSFELRFDYHESGREDVKEVAALFKFLIERFTSNKCKGRAKLLYDRVITSLPDSWLMWRIRLYVLCLCSSEYLPFLKESFYRIFEEENYSDLIKGAEYQMALMKTFPLLNKEDQTSYFNLTRNLFSRILKDDEDSYILRQGSRIFSVISDSLPHEKINELEDMGFNLMQGYIPAPLIVTGGMGTVRPKGPVDEEELRSISVSQLLDNLKNDWSPALLAEKDTEKDFLTPLNAEGMGKLIRDDIKNRLHEYLVHGNDFVDREKIDLHYLYSLLTGLTDAVNESETPLSESDWERLIAICVQITQSGDRQPAEELVYEYNKFDTWLARWNSVCSAITNLLKSSLGPKGKELGFKWDLHRLDILEIIEYFFEYPDPIPEDERIHSARMTESVFGQEPMISDPYTLAINSIRGRAYELFIFALELDEEDKSLEAKGISDNFKQLFDLLMNKEETRAIMFMIGHYIPTFFYRDKKWLMSQLDKIFPIETEKKFLYLAAWEGFLTNNLYVEIFDNDEINKLYRKAIRLPTTDYPNQKHFTNPEEGVAQHFALAYIVGDFAFGDDLFDYFWTSGTVDQHAAFVDKLGRFFISSENPRTLKLLEEDKDASKKLKKFWSWLLANCPDSNVFEGIGFWIDLDKGIFHPNELADYLARTLKLTQGYLNWNIGLHKCIIDLAVNSPENTLEIARLYLLEGCVRNNKNSLHFFLDKEWKDVFSILYLHSETQLLTLSLINDLIHEGGSFFWPLKDVTTGADNE